MEARSTEKVLVTGGAGFIGNHLVDALMSHGATVSVFDNLTSGTLQNIKQWLNNPNFTFVKGDLLNPADNKKLEQNTTILSFTWLQTQKSELAQQTQIYTSNKT